jgi:hypothetical protein
MIIGLSEGNFRVDVDCYDCRFRIGMIVVSSRM